jgi:hypothetical protein
VQCTSKRRNRNNCVVVDAKLSVFTDNGGMDLAMDEIVGVIQETMNMGLYNFVKYGIVQVSYRG